MKKTIISTAMVSALFLSMAATAPVAEAQSEKAKSISELMELVRQGKARNSAENRAREKRFRDAKAEQQRLLNEARAARTSAENRSEELETTYATNEDVIAEKTAERDVLLGDLKALFGVIGDASSQAAADFNASITNVQFPGRVDYLSDLTQQMSGTAELATMDDIDRLWEELMNEVVQTGKVVRFNTLVANPSGGEAEREVVRVGAFALVSDGKYLDYDNGVVSELVRQPDQSRFIGSTSAIVGASGDQFVKFGLDPTKGQILRSLVSKPTFIERIQQGSYVGYIIIALGVLAILVALERLVSLTIAAGKVNSQVKSDTINTNNALGRVLAVAEENKGASTDTLELKLGEAILKETPKLNRGLTFLKIIFVVAPLLGLLGTVTGMIIVFQQIVLYGTGDPSLMAGGISQALVTTAQGLAVAIPTVLLHTFVSGRSRKIVHILQEQSAGIIAERSERGG